MTIALFGATGRTGILIVEKALARGDMVKALVRDPNKLGSYKGSVDFTIGSLEESDKVNEVIVNSDVVINVTGHVKDSPKDIITIGVKNIISSMDLNGIKRLINLTGQGVWTEFDMPNKLDKLTVKMLSLVDKDRLRDGYNHVNLIRGSDLEWTVVRVPLLVNSEEKGEYAIGIVGQDDMGVKISRGDAAEFILRIIDNPEYFKKLPAIGWRKN